MQSSLNLLIRIKFLNLFLMFRTKFIWSWERGPELIVRTVVYEHDEIELL